MTLQNGQSNQNYDVFISYRHDTGFYMAQIVYTKLIANGYSVFMDKTLDSGKYAEKIKNAIYNCKNFVVILFPDDLEYCKADTGWLSKEAAWATECRDVNIIPIMCDKFAWPEEDGDLSEPMKTVKESNGVIVHKDYSLDTDLDKLCDSFLKNATPSKPRITTTEFFKYNLETRTDLKPISADMAFHAGAPWLMPGAKRDLIINSFAKDVKWRILINTVDAAESISKHMRDETALYVSFEQARMQWKKLAEMYPNNIEVRECPIPLIHVYHSIKFINEKDNHPYGETHVKYYAYNNIRSDDAYEHEISSFSKYYSVYDDEFAFLWNKSEKL